ncbi:DUF2283 domain-containing protein [Nonomuraea typhae]|uniref:DUF2283 domain-containing protein n=1 Tax=Nonomuraea typhae TaxID=2603600 RepID=UPI0012F9E609|nr:DUF2283 domain-containing protein [Nonomuraea typhae]
MTLERHPGEWTYDPEAGATYVYLYRPIPEGRVAVTTEIEAMVNLDFDADGYVIGIEIIARWPDASRLCDSCERCTRNPGADCGKSDHPHCPRCGHCTYRHTEQTAETGATT